MTLTAYADALFEFDKSTLTDKAEAPLKQALESIRSEKGLKQLRVRGHTDAKGSDAYNDRLSQSRAETVRDWLKTNEASLPPTTTEAVGEREPLKPNTNPDGTDNPEGRAFNRRVEIVLELCKAVPYGASGAGEDACAFPAPLQRGRRMRIAERDAANGRVCHREQHHDSLPSRASRVLPSLKRGEKIMQQALRR